MHESKINTKQYDEDGEDFDGTDFIPKIAKIFLVILFLTAFLLIIFFYKITIKDIMGMIIFCMSIYGLSTLFDQETIDILFKADTE